MQFNLGVGVGGHRQATLWECSRAALGGLALSNSSARICLQCQVLYSP